MTALLVLACILVLFFFFLALLVLGPLAFYAMAFVFTILAVGIGWRVFERLRR